MPRQKEAQAMPTPTCAAMVEGWNPIGAGMMVGRGRDLVVRTRLPGLNP